LGGPTNRYATAGITLKFIGAHKPLHPARNYYYYYYLYYYYHHHYYYY
jgi:hypothetical protein